MSVVHWSRKQAVGTIDPLQIDELAGSVLVIDGVTVADDEGLQWCRRAPCVVIGCAGAREQAPAAADVALHGEEREELLDALVGRIDANPHACRTLVDVLRPMPDLDVATGLTLESLAYSTLLAGPEFAAWLAHRPTPAPKTFDGPAVQVERRDSTLTITLARPGNRNAFSAPMRDALFEALTVVDLDDSIERLVLVGEGPVFSSGGDLTEFGTTADVVQAHEIRTRRSVGAVLARQASRSTVMVRGACVGAGVELAAFAGHVVAEPDTTFRLPEIAMGLIPGAGGTVSVARRIGRQRTARFAILGDAIDASEALAIGLIDEIR